MIPKQTLKRLVFLMVASAVLTACEGGGSKTSGSIDLVTTPPPDSTPDPVDPGLTPDPTPTPPPPAQTVQVFYYSKERTEAPINGWPTKTYTATGYCAVYETTTFCWDDGVKDVSIPGVFLPFTYSYWGVYDDNGIRFGCHGSCPGDAMTSPTVMSAGYFTNLTAAKIDDVLLNGAQNEATCGIENDVVTCDGFSFDVSGL